MTLQSKIVILLNNWTTFGKWNEEMKKELATQILALVREELGERIEKLDAYNTMDEGEDSMIIKKEVQQLITDTLNQEK